MNTMRFEIAGYLLLLLCVLFNSKQTTGEEAKSSDLKNITSGEKEDVQASIQANIQEDSMDNLMAQAVSTFGLNFINKLSSSGSENVVISPLSLQILLNMIHLGSKNGSKTEAELNKVLGYDNKHLLSASEHLQTSNKKLVFHAAMQNLTKSVESSIKLTPEDEERLSREFTRRGSHEPASLLKDPQVVFSLANMMLYNDDLVKPTLEYESEVKQFYDAKIEKFSSENLAALPDQVNEWTKNQTNGMIEKIMDKGDLNDKLVSVLLNAAYMRGRWMYPFQKADTHKETFYNEGKTAASVDFMSQTKHLEVGSFTNISDADDDLKKLNFTALSLPFFPGSGFELSMVILLPEERDGVAKLQSGLDAEKLHKIYKSLNEQEVLLKLPKFTFDTSVEEAKEVLTKLGLESIFSYNADFERMFSMKGSKSGVKVDKVKHKAKITVDEVGAEAGAVSSGSFARRSGRLFQLMYFTVDRPFLFIIRHYESGLPLFIGRVNKL